MGEAFVYSFYIHKIIRDRFPVYEILDFQIIKHQCIYYCIIIKDLSNIPCILLTILQLARVFNEYFRADREGDSARWFGPLAMGGAARSVDGEASRRRGDRMSR